MTSMESLAFSYFHFRNANNNNNNNNNNKNKAIFTKPCSQIAF